MAAKKGRALLMVWADIPAELEEEFNRWSNEEHLPELLELPGILNGARYEAVMGAPKHLSCYELENTEALESDAFKRFQANRSEWSKRISTARIATTLINNLFELIHPSKVTPEIAESDMAPALQVGRMDVPAELEDEFNDWYNTIYVPNYEKVPGCIRGRRFRVVGGEPKYLVVYEFEHERVSESPEWAVQREASPLSAKIRPQMRFAPGSPGIWKKTFQL